MDPRDTGTPPGPPSGAGDPAPPPRAVFRLPGSATVFAVVLAVCVIPLAGLGGAWYALFALPVAAVAWVLLTRTTADTAGITVRSYRGVTRLPWDTLDHLELAEARWTVAVQDSGRRTRLPMVLPRDLPALAAASGGALQFDLPEDPEQA